MPRDYVRYKQDQARLTAGVPGWVWFLTGLVSGGFVTFLTVIGHFVEPPEGQSDGLPDTPDIVIKQTGDAGEDFQWDFYDILPRSVVPLVKEYNDAGEQVQADDHLWVLQVASFRNPADADAQRARLLLMGMDVITQRTEVNGATWNRVIVGPFDSAVTRDRARKKLAEAKISSIPRQIPRQTSR